MANDKTKTNVKEACKNMNKSAFICWIINHMGIYFQRVYICQCKILLLFYGT